ncbi:uncharacterized mitochondrial protein AtMg00810-like [Miscanthus floridulus]|uniref:uncharacterized mitochondrial protein AtMg00810-like n=1 Tax=Miscanthus floridulus TaxID=154761 RepID=UPI003458B6C6
MKKAFHMSDHGLLCFYLSVEVRQDATEIALRQTHYTKRILELGSMTGCNLAHTSMKEKLKLSRESMAEEVDPTHYWWLIRSLRYLVHTRSDITFVVEYMIRFMERPTMEHLAPDTAWFISYYDSNLVGDVDTNKSTTRTVFFLGDCFVSWQSLKQKVVALSSC